MHKTLINKDLLCSMGNSILYSAITCMGNFFLSVDICIYVYMHSPGYTRETNTTLKIKDIPMKIEYISYLVTFPEWSIRAHHWINRKMFWGLEWKHSIIKKTWRDSCPNLTDNVIFLSQIVYYFLVNLVLYKTMT